jgi:small ligand-binding sensory domain FIST
MIVTRADGPRIVELDRGRPLDVLRELHASLGERDRMLMRAGLFCGVQMHDAQIEYGPGDFLVHDVVGVERGALVVSSRLEGYPAVQLHVRDPQASLESLSRALDAELAAGGESSGAVLFACRRRGVRLYGEADRDSRAFTERFGNVPLAGFFANGVIAPSRGTTYVHHHAASIGLFRKPKPAPDVP